MLNIIQNTIGAIRRVGESVVRAGLKMWLPFTTADHLGREVVSDNSFNDTNEWIKESGWTVSDGLATRTNVGSYSALQQHCLVSGTTYQVTIVIDSITSGELFGVRLGTNYIITDKSSANTYQGIGVANSTLLSIMGEPNFAGTISSISIKEATQISTDISSNENDAILKTGKALQFTGNDSVETSFPSTTPIRTIAFWVKPTHSSTNETLFYGGGAFGNTRQMYLDHLKVESINGNMIMNTYVNGQYEGVTFAGTPATLTQDEWQRVVLATSETAPIFLYSDDFDIGSGLYGSDGRFIISDLQIYDKAWTTDDIAYDYANPQKFVTDNTSSSISLSNLKGYWAFTEGDGGIAYDSSAGTAYEGTISGATYVDAQERILQLGMMNWSKGSNLLEYSEDLTEWTTGSNATLTYESDVVAPDGTVGVYRLLLPAQNSTFLKSPTYAAGSGRVFSMWVKKTNNNNTQFNFYDGSQSSTTFTATDEWQRFEMNGQAGTNAFVLNAGDTFISDIYIWGGQVESGTTASAYRRTNGTAVTDATLISSATDSQKDILGNAVRVKGSGFNLDGTGYGEVQHDSSLDFGTGDFSFSAWVKFSYISQGSSYNAIYTNGGLVDSAGSFGIMSVNGGFVRILVNNIPCSSTTLFSPGTWLHMVATRNSGTISLYINGNKTPEATATNSNTVTSSQNPRIGYDGNNARFYNDLIDDVQIYNRALTPDEVEQNYNATKTGHNN